MSRRPHGSHRPDDKLDGLLRDTLEPDRGTIDRLVATALDPNHGRTEGSGGRVAARRWQLAIAVAAVLLAIMAIPVLRPSPPSAPTSGARDAATPDVASAPRAHALLRISNEDGPVTVTSPAGSKMIFLPQVPLP